MQKEVRAEGMPWERSQQHFPGLLAASASRPQILTRGVSSLFLPSPSISSLCVGDSIPVFTLRVLALCSQVSLSYPAFLLRPKMSCISVIFLDAHRQLRLNKDKTKLSPFLPHPVSTNSFGVSTLLVLLSSSHARRQTGNQSWYLPL